MYIDAGEIVRVRIESDEFIDDEPGPPKAAEGVMAAKAERRRPPYTISVRRVSSASFSYWRIGFAYSDFRDGLVLLFFFLPAVFDRRRRPWTIALVESTGDRLRDGCRRRCGC